MEGDAGLGVAVAIAGRNPRGKPAIFVSVLLIAPWWEGVGPRLFFRVFLTPVSVFGDQRDLHNSARKSCSGGMGPPRMRGTFGEGPRFLAGKAVITNYRVYEGEWASLAWMDGRDTQRGQLLAILMCRRIRAIVGNTFVASYRVCSLFHTTPPTTYKAR